MSPTDRRAIAEQQADAMMMQMFAFHKAGHRDHYGLGEGDRVFAVLLRSDRAADVAQARTALTMAGCPAMAHSTEYRHEHTGIVGRVLGLTAHGPNEEVIRGVMVALDGEERWDLCTASERAAGGDQ